MQLIIVILSLVVSQTMCSPQTLLQCTKLSPLVGLSVPILDSTIARPSGALSVTSDCTVELRGFNISVFSTINLQRLTQANTLEPIFVEDIAIVNATFPQILTLRTGVILRDGDKLVFMSNRIPVAFTDLILPRTTTTTTTAPTTTIVRSSTSGSPSPSVSPAQSGTTSNPGKVYNPAKLVLVTLNSNANYPNPPTTQSVSFYINNVESAVLTLVRGNDYTFSIMGGAQHPFYLTSSIEGGKKLFPDSDEKIFLGNSSTWGTLQTPLLLPFKATDDLPNEFYYQCWNHTRMGWKVLLIKPNELQSNNIPPLVSGSERKSAAGLLISIFMVVLSVIGF